MYKVTKLVDQRPQTSSLRANLLRQLRRDIGHSGTREQRREGDCTGENGKSDGEI